MVWLVQVDIEGTIETQGSGDRGDNLSGETVEVGEARGCDVKALLADVVDSLVVDEQSECSRVVWVVRTEL